MGNVKYNLHYNALVLCVSTILLIIPVFIEIPSKLLGNLANNSVGKFIPIGLIAFVVLNFNLVFKSIKLNLLPIVFFGFLLVVDLFFKNFTLRIFIERLNFILFLIITKSYIDNKFFININIIKNLINILYFIFLFLIIIWTVNIDYIDKYDWIYPYNYYQYGAYIAYFSLLILSYLSNNKIKFLTNIIYIPLGYILYISSSSRLIFIVMIIYTFIRFNLIMKFISKFNPILLITFINVIYFLILSLNYLEVSIDPGRLFLLNSAINEIGPLDLVLPSSFEKLELYSSHNQVFEIYRALGFWGLIYFMWFMGYIFKIIRYNYCSLMIFYSYIIFGLVVLPFTHPYSYCIFTALFIISLSASHKYE